MRPQRSLHIIGGFLAGGAESFVTNLVPELMRQGHDAQIAAVVSRTDPLGSSMKDRLRTSGISYHVGPSARFGPRAARWLAGLIAGSNVDIVHVHGAWPEYAYYVAGLGRPGFSHTLVRTVHNSERPREWRIRWALNRVKADATVYCGEHVARVRRGRPERVERIIPNGIPFNWPIKDLESSSLAATLGIARNLNHFVNVASMRGETPRRSQKAHDILLEAWRMANLNGTAVLHLIGDGSLRSHLERSVAGDDSVVFHGIVENVTDWLRAADTFVLTSRWEGLPLAGIEAAGTGIPCIFSRIPQLLELNAPDVIYFEPDNPQDLARAMRMRCAMNELPPREEVESFRRRYALPEVAAAYIALYSSL